MNKISGESMNIVADNMVKLKEIFPEVFCEDKVDFERLQEVLGNYIEAKEERYRFEWNGKSKAIRIAQTSSTGTLRPCKKESKDWDTTQNLYIEGDNLEVLKLLQKSYQGKIKMIYIDPPYNTGKDFIYRDDYRDNMWNYLAITGQLDEDGKRVSTNSEISGRFHTDWLNMIYPRLRLAKNLLSDDGLIFISINDKELCNLKKICDEILGEENFIANFIWNTEGHTDNQYDVKVNHEYICLYCKNKQYAKLGYVVDPNTREESNLWKGFAENSITKNGPGNPPSEVKLKKGFPCKTDNAEIDSNIPNVEFFEEVKQQGYITRQITDKYSASYPIRFEKMIIKDGKLCNDVTVYTGWANVNKLKVFIENDYKPVIEDDGSEISFYLSPKGVIYYYKKRNKARNIVSVLRNMGTTEQMRSELENEKIFFTYPKPAKLINYLLQVGLESNDGIVLDFFSGSATTAHSVIEMNASDGGNRKFIAVQFPEKIDEKSEVYKAGFTNICDIAKKRIDVFGEKIIENNKANDNINNLDIGFKVFKLDSSNIKKWNPDYDELEQSFEDILDNFVPNRTEEDVVYEIMLKYGIDLSYPVEEKVINGKKVYSIGFGALIICLDNDISLDVVNGIVELKEELEPEICRVIFKDNGFATDSVKTNAVQILKRNNIKEVMSI